MQRYGAVGANAPKGKVTGQKEKDWGAQGTKKEKWGLTHAKKSKGGGFMSKKKKKKRGSKPNHQKKTKG